MLQALVPAPPPASHRHAPPLLGATASPLPPQTPPPALVAATATPTPTGIRAERGPVPFSHTFGTVRGSARQAPPRPGQNGESPVSPETWGPTSGPPRQEDLYRGAHPTDGPGHVVLGTRSPVISALCSPRPPSPVENLGSRRSGKRGRLCAGRIPTLSRSGPSARVRGAEQNAPVSPSSPPRPGSELAHGPPPQREPQTRLDADCPPEVPAVLLRRYWTPQLQRFFCWSLSPERTGSQWVSRSQARKRKC